MLYIGTRIIICIESINIYIYIITTNQILGSHVGMGAMNSNLF